MKRILLLIVIAFAVAFGAKAQQGMTQVGVNYTWRYDVNYKAGYSGVDFKLMYNTSNMFRIGLSYDIMGGYDKSNWMVNFDMHAFFNRVSRVRGYYILGFGYGKQTYKKKVGNYNYYTEDGQRVSGTVYDYKFQDNLIMADMGMGIDVRILDFLSAQVEAVCLAGMPTKFDKFVFVGSPLVRVGLTANF